MPEPIIVNHLENSSQQIRLAATGQSFEIHEWKGSGPDYLHVHYSDDEAKLFAMAVRTGTDTLAYPDGSAGICCCTGHYTLVESIPSEQSHNVNSLQ